MNEIRISVKKQHPDEKQQQHDHVRIREHFKPFVIFKFF